MVSTRKQAEDIFNILGIKDITTKTQSKNGTQVWKLPIQKMYSSGVKHEIRYASYKSGYMRNVSPNFHSCWQINKRYVAKKIVWNSRSKTHMNYRSYSRVLIEDKDDRMVYIANYILKNDYNSGDLLSVNEFTVSNINRASYELNNNVLVTRESWRSSCELQAEVMDCNNLLDAEILKGLDQKTKMKYLNSRIKLQTTALFDQDEEIKDLKLQIKAESWKRDEMWAKAARNHKHNASLYAPDVSITINGVKYTEDEN